MRRVTVLDPRFKWRDERGRPRWPTEKDYVSVPWLATLNEYPVVELVFFDVSKSTNPDNIKLILDSAKRIQKEVEQKRKMTQMN